MFTVAPVCNNVKPKSNRQLSTVTSPSGLNSAHIRSFFPPIVEHYLLQFRFVSFRFK